MVTVAVLTVSVAVAHFFFSRWTYTNDFYVKEKIFACLESIHGAEAVPPVRIGDVVVKDVCGTGVDVVATMEVGNDLPLNA